MVLLAESSKAQKILSENVRRRRLGMGLTQEDLSKRSGVALATLRKFEQKYVISLGSFLKLLTVLGGLDELLEGTKGAPKQFSSIDEVLEGQNRSIPQRGRRK